MMDVNGLHKNFRGIAAVRDVSFNVRQGEVVSLIGPERRREDDVLQLDHRLLQARFRQRVL